MFFFSKTDINRAVEECRNTPGAVLLDVRETEEFCSASSVQGLTGEYVFRSRS